VRGPRNDRRGLERWSRRILDSRLLLGEDTLGTNDIMGHYAFALNRTISRMRARLAGELDR